MKMYNTGVFFNDDGFGAAYTLDVYALGVDIVAAYFTRLRWCHRRVKALYLLRSASEGPIQLGGSIPTQRVRPDSEG